MAVGCCPASWSAASAVGGMTEAEARSAIETSLGALEDGQIELVSSKTTDVIRYAEVRRVIDADGMLTGALAHGRNGTTFDVAITGIQGLLRPASLPIRIGFSRPALAAKLAEFEQLGRRPATDATVRVSHGRAGHDARARGRRRRHHPGVRPHRHGPARPGDPIGHPLRGGLGRDPARHLRFGCRAGGRPCRAPIRADPPARRSPGAGRSARMSSRAGCISRGAAPITPRSSTRARSRRSSATSRSTSRSSRPMPPSCATVAGGSSGSAPHPRVVRSTSRPPSTASSASSIGRATGASTPAKVSVATKAVGPDLTTGEATKKAPLVERVGSWTTYYQVSAHNGFAANITIPARRLDGVVVRPGETFDFWRALGEVSFRTGYRLGGAIVGGHSVEGRALAGGICAASTTLFNAAARGGLQVVARQPHWYYITRYPLGLDATVSDSQTMRFRNDTKHPVMIKSRRLAGRRPLRDLERPQRANDDLVAAVGVERGGRLRHRPVHVVAATRRAQADRIPGRRQGRVGDADGARRLRARRAPRHVRLALPPDGGHHARRSLRARIDRSRAVRRYRR